LTIEQTLEELMVAVTALKASVEKLEQSLNNHEDICSACKRQMNDKAWDQYRAGVKTMYR
jgi:uncharacterized coiled-coil protein SlyX